MGVNQIGHRKGSSSRQEQPLGRVDEVAASRRPPFMTLTSVLPIIIAFLLTRLVCAYLAGAPEVYSHSAPPATLDALLGYKEWGHEIVELRRAPYSESGSSILLGPYRSSSHQHWSFADSHTF